MNRFIRNKYSHVKIRLDNQSYEECEFNNCVIEYSGEGPISLIGCTFNKCQWVFVGSALNTLKFMESMYHDFGEFGKNMIDATFSNIKKNSMPHIEKNK